MIALVLYKLDAKDTFDLDYYLQTHMPLVRKLWGPLGMNGTQVLQGIEPAPYHVVTTLDFESMEAFKGAVAAHGKEIMGDVPNFTSVSPVIQFNEIAG